MITAGRVNVDGTLVRTPGARVHPGEAKILIDDQPLPPADRARTLMLNKPPGYVCSTNAAQGETVYALLPDVHERVVPVGRLDKASEGLLLMSNDGALIHAVTHPRHGHAKRYAVTVHGRVTPHQLQILRRPIQIDGVMTQPARVRLLNAAPDARVLEFILGEGRNRQIRRLCAQAGLHVERLVRVAINTLKLGDLAPGASRDLTPEELLRLTSY